MTVNDRRRNVRRATDCCYLTREQIEDLVKKVESNHVATIQAGGVERRLTAVEEQVKSLCSRITKALWALVGSSILAVGALIAAIWHIVTWIQKLIEHSIIIS